MWKSVEMEFIHKVRWKSKVIFLSFRKCEQPALLTNAHYAFIFSFWNFLAGVFSRGSYNGTVISALRRGELMFIFSAIFFRYSFVMRGRNPLLCDNANNSFYLISTCMNRAFTQNHITTIRQFLHPPYSPHLRHQHFHFLRLKSELIGDKLANFPDIQVAAIKKFKTGTKEDYSRHFWIILV